MNQFLVKNRVFLLGLLASVAVVFQQFVGYTEISWKAVSYAVFMAILSYIANQWRGKAMSILGIIGTLAGTFVTINQTGNFTWNQFILSAIAALLATVAPPPKSSGYEKTHTITHAKEAGKDITKNS